jgi:predicted alpha/beta superfamily hydrolase
MYYFLIILFFALGYLLVRPRHVNLIIKARAPEYIKNGIFLCGNLPELGAWKEHIPLVKQGDGIYSLQLRVRKNQQLLFKFTLGNWETVEKGAYFSEVANRSILARKNLAYEFSIQHFSGFEEASASSTLCGDIRYLRNFPSRILHNHRNIIIYLPPSYKTENNKRYPVLYMHDGNNIFDNRTAFGGVDWQVDETAQALIEKGFMKEVIIVGIYNTMGRLEEYTPVYCPLHGGGKGKDYLNFIIKELMPTINNKFRTMTGAKDTGIMGSSLGGLISLYAGFEHPEVFGNIGVVSPSLWWADNYMEKEYLPSKTKPGIKIWLDMGSHEGVINQKGDSVCIKNTRAVNKLLLKMGFKKEHDLFYFEHKGATHDESSWASRIHMPLLFFYGQGNCHIKLEPPA